MVPKLQDLLDKFSLTKTKIAYIKDEVSNLQPCANALICLYHIVIWPCWSRLMAHVWGMHF